MEVQKMKGNIKRIGLVLLTLLTLSLGTLVVNAETKDSDFVIENGVLKQYKGNDDTVYIPEGVTKITSDAFKREYSDYEKWGMYSGDMTERDNSFMLKDKFYARKIVLSSTVKEIESFAIPQNTEELVLNEGLEILDDAALYNVSATTLEIPSTLKKIGNDAFSLTVKKITGNCKDHLDAGPGQHAAALRRRWPHHEHRSRDELYRSCHQSDRTGADGHKFQRRSDPWINKKTSAFRRAEVFFISRLRRAPMARGGFYSFGQMALRSARVRLRRGAGFFFRSNGFALRAGQR